MRRRSFDTAGEATTRSPIGFSLSSSNLSSTRGRRRRRPRARHTEPRSRSPATHCSTPSASASELGSLGARPRPLARVRGRGRRARRARPPGRVGAPVGGCRRGRPEAIRDPRRPGLPSCAQRSRLGYGGPPPPRGGRRLHRFAGGTVPPPADVVTIYREGVAAELKGIAEIARDAELVAARCCDVCRGDDKAIARISTELRTPRLPHAGCTKGLCRCRWDLATRDRQTLRRYLRRRPGPHPASTSPQVSLTTEAQASSEPPAQRPSRMITRPASSFDSAPRLDPRGTIRK